MSQITWGEWLRKRDLSSLYAADDASGNSFDTLAWSPGEEDKAAAWQLYTELRTRVATRPLPFRWGHEDTALESLHRLFEVARHAISTHQGCVHFATLTVQILDLHVRPFTTKWHRMNVDGQLGSADVRYRFRRELTELQGTLRRFTGVLAELAGDTTSVSDEWTGADVKPKRGLAELWNQLDFGIDEDGFGGHNPERINAKEREEIANRRRFYGLGNSDTSTDAVGLAISGGGIRSATFALGVVQVLSKKGVLRQIDYLSTVSGGGYLGAFISSFLNDESRTVSLESENEALPFGCKGSKESQGVRHLRNHSKYLTEGGFETIATIVGQIAYGLLVSVLLVSPLFALCLLLIKTLGPESLRVQPGVWATWTATSFMLTILAVMILLLPIPQNWFRNPAAERLWSQLCVGLAMLSLVLLVCQGFPYAFFAIEKIGGAKAIVAISALLPLILGAIGLRFGFVSIPGRIALSLFLVAGPLLMMAVLLLLCQLLVVPNWPHSTVWLLGLTLGTFLYSSFFLNINFASPHRFYRDRLGRTYLTRAENGIDEVVFVDPQPLSSMNLKSKSPYHLINAALNIPSCKDPNLRGRNTDFFLFSKHFCGSPIIGFHPTIDWEAMDRHLDLGTAVAISGAAAAPHMGTLTSSRFTFLLAMLNVRLGYWARRPSRSPRWIEKFLPPSGCYYFVRELTGMMPETTNYLNLSDGGHIENLGVYELLRRRCKFVVAIDGEADPTRSFGGLLKLTQYALIDLGVRIEPDLGDIRTDRDGQGRAHFSLSRIDYPGDQYGLLLYIKSSLTGNESEFLKKYRSDNPSFPHQSTAQQLFTETQFEAYRALGEHVAEDLFRTDLVGNWKENLSVHQLFHRLAENLF